MNLLNAQKLMALYVKQVAALDKHRGKGQQKVTVEHVHVGAGGQAIVGTVEAGAAAGRRAEAARHPPRDPDRPRDCDPAPPPGPFAEGGAGAAVRRRKG
jgi:hypothetical protein